MNCWAALLSDYFHFGCGAVVAVGLRAAGNAFSCLCYFGSYPLYI